MQGGFVNLDIVVGYDNPTHILFCTEIEITHSILRLNNPVALSCKRSIAWGLDQTWSCLGEVTTSHITTVFQLSTVVRLSVQRW